MESREPATQPDLPRGKASIAPREPTPATAPSSSLKTRELAATELFSFAPGRSVGRCGRLDAAGSEN
jgi:hypothetical protein